MKKLLIAFIFFSSCHEKSVTKIDNQHVEKLAMDFMESSVIPKMKDPKPFEVSGAKVIVKTVADKINEYQFIYDHLSLSHEDSLENKRHLDSVIAISLHPDSVISVTVNVGYKTKYKLGDVITDSIKLGYNPEKDEVSLWPF